jgi:SAM-dependent methyltransferase
VPGEALPLPDASVDLVTSRHPVRPAWEEVARVLVDGGTYLAQHVGAASAFEVVEAFLGPQPEARRGRDADAEAAAAEAAGLDVVDLRTARCRMEFHDIGAVVWTLRKCVWWVPDFSVERYEDVLRGIDAQLRHGEPFVAHSSRTLFDARRRPR